MSSARHLAIALAIATASLAAPLAHADPGVGTARSKVAQTAKRTPRAGTATHKKADKRTVQVNASGVIPVDTAGGIRELSALAHASASLELGDRTRTSARTSSDESELFDKQPLRESQIQKLFREHRDELEGCYMRIVARGGSADRRLSASFTIQADGSVSQLRVRASGAQARSLERCITNAVEVWEFPDARVDTPVERAIVIDGAGE